MLVWLNSLFSLLLAATALFFTNRTSTLGGLTNQAFAYSVNDWLDNDTNPGNGSTNFDANGNTRTNGANAFFYDAENRLTNAIVGGTSVTIIYDGDGNRVRKIVGTTTNTYLVDRQNPTGYAQVLEEHVSLNAQPSALNRVFDYGLDLISQRESGGTVYYFIYDGHGSTRALYDGGGNFLNAFAYNAYGTLIASNGAPQTAYLYCGEYLDSYLGLVYLRARYLNPGTGRFWTRDTFEGHSTDPLSLHKYLYGADDPVNNIDPSGNEFTLIGTLKVAGIQGVIGASLSFGIDYAVHRDLKRAGKAAGWGFIIGAGTGAAFHGIRAILVARGAAQALGVTVTTASTELITATADGALIGVIDDGVIQVFKSGPGVFMNAREILGHADLIAAGLVKAGSQGFSVIVKAGQVVNVRAYSAINAAAENFSVGAEKAAAIVDALKAYAAEVWLTPSAPL